jgi:5-methylcytosine-specific restriction endonuclease McrA
VNSRVLCQGCRLFRDPAEMQKVGLGYICGDRCMELVRKRAREKRARREANKSSHSKGLLDRNRKAAKRRDLGCRWCRRTSCLQVHHIRYRSQGGGHELDNLITLCQVCHEHAHSDKRRWQPVLLELIRIGDEELLFLTVPEVEARMARS